MKHSAGPPAPGGGSGSLADPEGPRRWRMLAWPALAFLACLGTIVPLMVFRYPAIQDYPNHLARIFIIRHADDPVLAANYRVVWELLPNLGWEGLMLPLAYVMPVETAGRLALALITLLVCAGVATLNRVIVGRWTAVPLLAAPLLFSQPFTWGFLAFDLGIGVALFATAWWLALNERHWRMRLLGATAFSTLLFATHFAAWAIYGVVMLGVQADRYMATPPGQRRLAAWALRCCRDAMQVLPVIALLVLMVSGAAEPSGAPTGPRDFQWPWIRIVRLFSIIDTGRPLLTVVAVAVFAGAIAFGIRRNALTPSPLMRTPLILLAALFFCLPDKIAATTHVSVRPLIGLAVWGMASLGPGPAWNAFSARLSAVMAALILLVCSSRLPGWIATQSEVAAFARLVEDIPVGDRVYFIHAGIDGDDIRAHQAGTYHEASYAVLWRKLLVQSMFAYPGQQPLRFRALEDQMRSSNAQPVLKDLAADLSRRGVGFADQIKGFDNLIVHGPITGIGQELALPETFRLARSEGDLRLYRRYGDATPAEERRLRRDP